MKSFYYNWIKFYFAQDKSMSSPICEETWGQFVDLEINDNIEKYNNKYKSPPCNTLVKYEPSLVGIQENAINVHKDDNPSDTFEWSISLLGLYTMVNIGIQYFMVYNNNRV